ncbi:MAG: hypothetical protein GX660_03560 [Clostridiaceae bacterium]|nr:hypothetical protein [Clostridiaceae bacterium]
MSMNNLLKNRNFVVIISIVLVLSVVSLGLFAFSGKLPWKGNTQVSTDQPLENPFTDMKIIPLVQDSTGVALTSGFKVLFDNDASESTVKDSIKVSPEIAYDIKKTSRGEFLLNPKEELKANSIYRFSLAEKYEQTNSWAFQTKKTFRVLRTLPRDKSISVPQNTGIEITFSHDKPKDVEAHFEISPKVEGRFEYHGKTVVFVPKELLKKEVIYTVKLSKGIGLTGSDEKIQEDFVFSFQVESEIKKEYSFFSFSDTLFNFTSKTVPALNVNVSDKYKNTGVTVDVFKYNSDQDFYENVIKPYEYPVWSSTNKSQLDYDLSKLQKVSTFKTKIEEHKGNYWYMNFIIFPSTLPQGQYLINVTCDNGEKYNTHIQINDTVAYFSILNSKALVWVNDTLSGNPVSGAKVEFQSSVSSVTGEDGVAVIDDEKISRAKEEYLCFKISRSNSPSLYTFCYNNSYYYPQDTEEFSYNNYWRYLYLDRGIYLPDDTVRIWGLLKPRNSEEIPSKVEVQLFRYDYSYNDFMIDDSYGVIESKEISLSKFGTYQSEMSFNNLNSGMYAIRLRYNNKIVSENVFEVTKYTKPAYRIELDAGKGYTFNTDKINVGVNASFFEGSPVAKLGLQYDYFTGSHREENKITCDDNGKSSIELTSHNPDKSWRPNYLYLNVRNSNSEEQEVRANASIAVFHSDTMIVAKGKLEGTKGVVDVETNLIDTGKLDSLYYYYDHEEYKGSSVDMDLKADVYENYYEKKETGEYYDFINKVTQKTYEYYHVQNKIGTIDFRTVNGKGSFSFDYSIDKKVDKYYTADIYGKDSKGHEIVEKIHIYDWSSYSDGYDNEKYALKNQSGKDTFKTGEAVKLAVKYNKEEIPEGSKGKALFVLLKNGLVEYTLSENARYERVFDKECIPNIYFKALYFDGSYIYDTGMQHAFYDSSERKLDISVAGEKEQYRPGETVDLEVLVKDSDNNPCAAEVNISVVDEALFALRDQYVDTLSSIYSPTMDPGIIIDFVSHKTPEQYYNPMAECGEGGDVGIRTIFKDTAFFNSIVTGKDGKGKISFKIPDNLTSWRVTYQGVTEDLKAGSGSINITSKLPFFTDVIFNNTFMEGDKPFITMRSYGSSVKSGDQVKYSVILESPDGQKKTFNIDGKVFETAVVELDSLKEGKYSVTANAVCGSLKDSLKKDFKVAKNVLEASKTGYYKLENGLKPEGGSSLSTLVFYNSVSTLLHESLYSLLYTWGQRVDQRLARKISADYLNKLNNEELPFYKEEEFDFTKYQLADGGIALLSYDSSDPVLTARICAICPELFDVNGLRAYLYNVLANSEATPEEVFSSYYGLAALKEPVLIDAYNLLTSPDLSVNERIYLALALAELGDYDKAGEVYNGIIKDYGEKTDPYYFINTKMNRDEVLETTALCSMLAFKLNKEESQGMFGYVTSSKPKELLLNLEKMSYIKNSIPAAKQNGKFSYTINGVKKEVTLDKDKQFRLMLREEELDTLEFSGVEGDISLVSIYTGSPKDMMNSEGNSIKLTREYTVNGEAKTAIKQSDLVRIVIKPEMDKLAPDGYYEITDMLPAALRYIEPSYYDYSDDIRYPFGVDGQKVTYGFYYTKNVKVPTFVCMARAVCPGEYNCDNTYIKHYDSNFSGFSERQKITVKK